MLRFRFVYFSKLFFLSSAIFLCSLALFRKRKPNCEHDGLLLQMQLFQLLFKITAATDNKRHSLWAPSSSWLKSLKATKNNKEEHLLELSIIVAIIAIQIKLRHSFYQLRTVFQLARQAGKQGKVLGTNKTQRLQASYPRQQKQTSTTTEQLQIDRNNNNNSVPFSSAYYETCIPSFGSLAFYHYHCYISSSSTPATFHRILRRPSFSWFLFKKNDVVQFCFW